ncbi:MAG: type VI secretion system protein TssA [Rubrivivax sp.]|nr:type VI secretion system protein TssA [Rubrivivax sp.]
MALDSIAHSLTQPFSGDVGPCGPDMVFSPEFDQLADLRRQDDATLDQGEWVTELKRADWPAAAALAEQLLGSRTKDLRLAAWWAEAAAHVRGFDGLADGLWLYAALCREHWAAVHPLPDDGDHELRVGSINWLLTQTRLLCGTLPVLQGADRTYSLIDIETARQRSPGAGAATGGIAAPADGKPMPLSMDAVVRAQRNTPKPRVLALLQGARRLPDALAQLEAVVDNRLGAEGPGFATTRDAVRDAVTRLERLARELGVVSAETSVVVSTVTPGAAQTPVAGAAEGLAAGPPNSRAQALAQLRMVAEFFRRTEPHSPVAYLADRAAHWGEMPLHEWLRSVLKEQGTLAQLEELLGVKPDAGSSQVS